MLLGALLDAGASEERVREALDALNLEGWTMEITETTRRGLRAKRVEVKVEAEPARSYPEVRALLEGSALTPALLGSVLAVFERIASAEAAVHGTSVEQVHLHEVGATDALIDVTGVCAALHDLAPEGVTCSPIASGAGTVTTDHGDMPLPVPAVVALLEGAPMVGRGTKELITPTGAALLAHWVDGFGDLPAMHLDRVGSGAGANDLEWPNVVRAFVGRSAATPATETLVVIEANLDDLNPELFPYVIERLIEAGANDAWVTPIVMKKGRPATTLSVLCDEGSIEPLSRIVFRETSTLGLRIDRTERRTLDRSWIEVTVGGEPIRVKAGYLDGEIVNLAPEFEDAKRAAATLNRPLKDIYADAIEAARRC